VQIENRSDTVWQLTNPGGMTTLAYFPLRVPTANFPLTPQTAQGNQNAFPGQGVLAAGDGVVEMGGREGQSAPMRLLLMPFGQGQPGQSFWVRCFGWTPTTGTFWGGKGNQGPLWLPVLLGTWGVVLGGPLQAGVPNTDLGPQFAFSVARGGGVGMIVVPAMGFRYVEVTFALGDGVNGAAGANALYRKL
jgi:hypothetical protein